MKRNKKVVKIMNNKLKRIIKKVRLKTILLLAITIASNSFAWFIYTTEVKTNMDTRVREWKVTFDSNGEHVEKVITLNVKELYPGMKSYTETLTASNTGESKAKIDFEIKEAKILGEDLLLLNMTNDELIEYLKTNYPFKIELSSSNGVIEVSGQETVTINVYWPYESGNDELDTYWGNKSYDYHQLYPDNSSLSLVIKITAYQINE